MNQQSRALGSGWMSGVLSVALGGIGLGAVFCFHYPSILTMPELRSLYPVPFIRALLHLVLVGSFIAGVISVCLRRRKILGMVGISLTLGAALLGGSRVPLDGELQNGPFLGLDWFLLNLMAYSAVFIPLERLFARLPEQDVFRRAWRTDLAYFFLSALLVQVTTLLTMRPAMTLFAWAISADVQRAISAQPLVVQFVEILILTDFVQYLGASSVSPCAAAVALPSHSPLGRRHGLACRVAPASGGRGGHAWSDLRADLRARICRDGACGVRRVCQHSSHVHPRQRPIQLRLASVGDGHAAVPSLAPRRRARGRGQELRRPSTGSRPAVRHLPSTR